MPFIPETDTRDAATIHRDMLASMWRALAGRQGWKRHNNAAGVEWGAQYEPTGALLLPRVTAPRLAGVRRVRDWLVCVPVAVPSPRNPYNYEPCVSVSEAVWAAESLPIISPRAVPTHYDGHGAACWCDQPRAVRVAAS